MGVGAVRVAVSPVYRASPEAWYISLHYGPRVTAHPRQALVQDPPECRASRDVGRLRHWATLLRWLRPHHRGAGRGARGRASGSPDAALSCPVRGALAGVENGPTRRSGGRTSSVG